MSDFDLNAKIYLAGHTGLAGSAIARSLAAAGFKNVICRTHRQLDLTSFVDTLRFFESERPQYVLLAAARVGGVYANRQFPGEFIFENLQIQNNVIESSRRVGVERLVCLSSASVYSPSLRPPYAEADIFCGEPDPSVAAYATAKRAGIEMCRAYRSQYNLHCLTLIPTNLYGLNDRFGSENSHVIAAMIEKFQHAKQAGSDQVVIWGSGKPTREFLYADDLAAACLLLLTSDPKRLQNQEFNVSSGETITIADLARTVASIVGFRGGILWDTNKPDGAPNRQLDCKRLNALGWRATTPLEHGIQKVNEIFQARH